MKICSVRLGFANNSSSSHSIIIVPPGKQLHDSVDDGDYYGWETFTLASKEEKQLYFASQVRSILTHKIGVEAAEAVARDITGLKIKHDRFRGVDHQSIIGVPYDYGTDQLSVKFLRELYKSYMDPSKVVLGGNDNDGMHPLADESQSWKAWHTLDWSASGCTCREDGKFWTLFNPTNGTKIRLSFDDNAEPPRYASNPELVDLCITKQCMKRCRYCYQDATEEGQHADFKKLETIIWQCAQSRVFEIALGGGEPTNHPDFTKILESIHDRGIVPNFSTAQTGWMAGGPIADAVKKYCGSFSVSLSDEWRALDVVKQVFTWNRSLALDNKGRAVLQIPLGCVPWNTIEEALEFSTKWGHGQVTMLGYKSCGRAPREPVHPYHASIAKWLKTTAYHGFTLAVDTLFAEEFKKELKKLEVDNVLIADKEGAFSCYVDAVEMQVGAHSYGSKMQSFEKGSPFDMFPFVK